MGLGKARLLPGQARFMPPARHRERMVFHTASQNRSLTLTLTPLSRGICVASFEAEGGACPAGFTIRQRFGAVPFTTEMGGHVLVTQCPYWVVDCASGEALPGRHVPVVRGGAALGKPLLWSQ